MNRGATRLLEGGCLWSDAAPRTLEELQNSFSSSWRWFSRWTQGATTTHYMAVAVMQHWGPYCASGHNVTLVRKDSNAGSEWWLCNDEDILWVSSACVTRNAVAVLYRRVSDS